VRWLVADWDAWRFDAGDEGGALADLAMRREEGAETVERVLSAGPETRLVISTADLEARLASWVTGPADEGATADDAGAAAGPRHARPEMHSDYKEPADDVERGVVGIWEDLLGIDGVGANDDFLELGGNSLLAVQVVSRLRQKFGINMPIQTLFEAPTPVQLGERIKTALWVVESQEAAATAGADEDREEEVF
jgi:acyl carrier protein